MGADDLLAPLVIDTDDAYPLGAPVHVGVTLSLTTAEAMVWIPPTDPLLAQEPIELGLSSLDDGRVVFPLAPFSPRPRHDDALAVALTGNSPRRALVDLSPWLPPDLAPGSYRATLRYHCLREEALSPPFALHLRAPHAGDRTFLAELTPPKQPDQTWGQWTLSPPSPRPPELDALFRDDPVRFNRALRHLLVEAARLDTFNLSLLDRLTGVYALDGALLQVELLRMRGEVAAAEALADRVRADHPGGAAALDALDRDEGPIATMRGAQLG
jgi:hypothetical protein